MENKKNLKSQIGSLIFGLDIGIASVGWAVLAETRIVALGVRAFDKAETPDKGESLNLARRSARLMRRRLRRRAWRLTKLGRLLKRYGAIADANLLKGQPSFTDSTWALRVAGLDRLLNNEEWARVQYDKSTNELVILAMAADPKPMDTARHWNPKCPVVEADSDAVKSTVSNGLEMQRWMVWIDFELGEISVRNGFYFDGQCVKALPEAL